MQSVLASGLPVEVGTPHEPSLYTVPAVFSRRVTPEERSRIEDPATAEDLMATTGAGPGLALAVSDRRLLIVNTNLAQLKDGLAMAIGRMLSRLDEDLLTEQDERDAAAELLLASEVDRAARWRGRPPRSGSMRTRTAPTRPGRARAAAAAPATPVGVGGPLPPAAA